MDCRRLGKSGIRVSALSFGAWVTFGNHGKVDDAIDMMGTAYDAGVNFFDNAEIYGRGKAELVMGEALNKLGWRWDSFLISSKVLWGIIRNSKPTQYGLHPKQIFEASDQAMERLGVDDLDLYLRYRPEPDEPMEEVVHATADLIQTEPSIPHLTENNCVQSHLKEAATGAESPVRSSEWLGRMRLVHGTLNRLGEYRSIRNHQSCAPCKEV